MGTVPFYRLPPESFDLGKLHAPTRLIRTKSLERPLSLLNHFKLGADPEFLIVNPTDKSPLSAADVGLSTGLAFGADLSGRSAELRAAPYKSSLSVVASLLEELRWLGIMRPRLQGFSWVSGPAYNSEPLGGHLHFGRKRPTSPLKRGDSSPEIVALDLLSQKVQPKLWVASALERRQSSRYGNFSDFRPQAHGYEYRTLPSWLGSPWMAFLVLTLGKLTVYDPELTYGVFNRANPATSTLVASLLGHYATRDDDALVAYWGFKNFGFSPYEAPIDIKPAWGLGTFSLLSETPTVIPPVIEPSLETKQALLEHFISGQPLNLRTTTGPLWTPSVLPKDFSMVLDTLGSAHNLNLGELVWDMCFPKKFGVRFSCEGDSLGISEDLRVIYPKKIWQKITKAWPGRINISTRVSGRVIYFGRDTRRAENLEEMRAFLNLGLLPIFKMNHAEELSFRLEELLGAHSNSSSTSRRSKLLYSTVF